MLTTKIATPWNFDEHDTHYLAVKLQSSLEPIKCNVFVCDGSTGHIRLWLVPMERPDVGWYFEMFGPKISGENLKFLDGDRIPYKAYGDGAFAPAFLKDCCRCTRAPEFKNENSK